ncbi:hypothetical protein RND81_01G211900 [Saponaria officinalis]|uniref:Uncharacterized protein n=1 Tax=Saponaria officinalis TaxID=3572 RepID=A0AAW1NK12_SAPOF
MTNFMAQLSYYSPKTLLNIHHDNTKLFYHTNVQHYYSIGHPRKHVSNFITCASKFGSGNNPLNSVFKKCDTCRGRGGIDCPGCKGTGKNKKNGNIFERWKCFECQGFGLKSCPDCGKGGLTPEQRGER